MKNAMFLFVVLLIAFMACSTRKIVNEKRMVNFTEVKSKQEMLSILKKENKLGLLYWRPCNYRLLEEIIFKDKESRIFIERNFSPVRTHWYVAGDTTHPNDVQKYYNSLTLQIIDSDGEVILDLISYAFAYWDSVNFQSVYYKGKELVKKLEEGLKNAKTYVRLKRGYAENRENGKIALEFADMKMGKYKFEDAMCIYQDLIPKITDTSVSRKIYSNLLTIYGKPSYQLVRNNLDKAIKIVEEGLAKRMFVLREDDVNFVLGNMYFWKRDYLSAIRYHEKVPPDYVLLTYPYSTYLFLSYFKSGQKEKGEAILETRLSGYFMKKYIFSLAYLETICAENNVYIDESLSLLGRCDLSINVSNYYIIRAYGQILARANKIDKANEIYKKMIEYMKKKPHHWPKPLCVELAIINYRAGRKEYAMQVLNEPDNPGTPGIWEAWLLYKNSIDTNLSRKWISDELNVYGIKDVREYSFDSETLREYYVREMFRSGAASEGLEIATFNPLGNNNVE